MMRVPDGSVRLAVQGVERMRIIEWVGEEPYLIAVVERLPETIEDIGRGQGADAQHGRAVPAARSAGLAPAR